MRLRRFIPAGHTVVLRFVAFLLFTMPIAVAYGESGGTSDDVSRFISVEPRSYNATIDDAGTRGANWTNLPFSIAANLFGPEVYTEGRIRYSIDYTQNQRETATITVTVEGSLDDSISAERRIIKFNKSGDKWLISDIRLGVKCQTGRGHASFSGLPCR